MLSLAVAINLIAVTRGEMEWNGVEEGRGWVRNRNPFPVYHLVLMRQGIFSVIDICGELYWIFPDRDWRRPLLIKRFDSDDFFRLSD